MPTATKYFDHLSTVEDIKAEYRRLAKQHHPDLGGDTATMQDINNQYLEALQNCDGQTSTGSDKKEHTYYYNEDLEKMIMEVIDKLLTLKMADVDIILIGTWVWIKGDTKPHKEDLKGLKCRWHGKRKCWYWASPNRRRSFSTNGSLSDLAEKYGSKHFRPEDNEPKRRQPAAALG